MIIKHGRHICLKKGMWGLTVPFGCWLVLWSRQRKIPSHAEYAVNVFFFSFSGFIEFIVFPTYEVCSELLEVVLESSPKPVTNDTADNDQGGKERAWAAPLAENRKRWKEQCLTASPKGRTFMTVAVRIIFFFAKLKQNSKVCQNS